MKTEAPYSSNTNHYLHTLFEIQAKQYSQHPAFIYENEQTSYIQLEQRANQLSRRLMQIGIGVGKCVGIFLERNDFAYTAMLAVLKAGAAYVPLDPEYPRERIHFILQDCRVELLITSKTLIKNITTRSCKTFIMEHELPHLDHESTAKIDPKQIGLTGESLCYVIYTSGSTGNPKGVEITHNSVCNYLHEAKKVYKIQNNDRVYQGFSIAFDASIEEIWTTLTSGATLISTNNKALRSGAGLVDFLNHHKVSFFSTVPTLLTMLEPPIPSLRLLVLGGEVCHEELVNRWSQPNLRIINTYGPTEATVVTTYSECSPGKPVTIGQPFPSYEVYILNSELKPVDVNEAGEICIGGICLSRGYVNRPDLNQAKFIIHPELQNKLLYRTGDLGRQLENGDLQFLGRLDGQIKLRGFRIELDEIEAVIMEYPGIRKTVVSVWKQPAGVETLVAYLIPADPQTFSQDNLLNFLRSRLPLYMTPDLFEITTELPLLPSGKVDRKNLPLPTIKKRSCSKKYLAPQNETEAKIAHIWEQLFQCQKISTDADFFYDLGGHSLLAARAVSLLREDSLLQYTSMLDIYQNPTIEKLAKKMMSYEQRNPLDDRTAKTEETSNPSQNKISNWQYYLSASLQFIGCYFQFALISWEVLLIILATGYMINKYSLFSLPTLSVIIASIVLLPALLVAFSIGIKWLLLGRVKPGVYRVWGAYYLRWWFVRQIQKAIAPIAHLAGSPLINLYCRLMGAKIGKNCYIGTAHIGIFDLLSIDDDSSINQDASLLGYTVENGLLKIGSITIGKRCFVGVRSVLCINTVIENDGILEDLSMLPSQAVIPQNQYYHGSPARPLKAKKNDLPHRDSIEKSSRWQDIQYGLMHYFGLIFVTVIYGAALTPGIALVDYFYEKDSLISSIFIAAPLGGLSFILLVCLSIILTKKIFGGKMQAGSYKLKSSLYVRQWITDQLMGLPEVEVLAESLYLPIFMRLLGANIGKRVEIADLPHITPELFTIKDESFTAGGVMAGVHRVNGGYVTYGSIIIGKRTFVGSTAVLPPQTELGDHCLIGCLTIPPLNGDAQQSNTAWLGSPALFLPKREVASCFSEERTFMPPKWLYMARAAIELIRVTLPATFYFLILIGFFLSIDFLFSHYSLLETFLFFPVFDMAILTLLALAAIGLKWILMGKYKPDVKPLWCLFIWKSDLLERLHNIFLARMVFDPLLGTPFVAFFLRLLGVKIGKRVFIDSSSGFAEYDLVDIGNDVALNEGCVMLTHLFEDRIFKMDKIKIGDGCTVGCYGEVLYDAVMGKYATLGSLSLLMKGERLPAYTHWEGLPSQKIKINIQFETSNSIPQLAATSYR